MSGYMAKNPYIYDIMRQMADAKNKASHQCQSCGQKFEGKVYWVCEKNSAYLLHVCNKCTDKYER